MLTTGLLLDNARIIQLSRPSVSISFYLLHILLTSIKCLRYLARSKFTPTLTNRSKTEKDLATITLPLRSNLLTPRHIQSEPGDPTLEFHLQYVPYNVG